VVIKIRVGKHGVFFFNIYAGYGVF